MHYVFVHDPVMHSCTCLSMWLANSNKITVWVYPVHTLIFPQCWVDSLKSYIHCYSCRIWLALSIMLFYKSKHRSMPLINTNFFRINYYSGYTFFVLRKYLSLLSLKVNILQSDCRHCTDVMLYRRTYINWIGMIAGSGFSRINCIFTILEC
jgi:hypothetical protein